MSSENDFDYLNTMFFEDKNLTTKNPFYIIKGRIPKNIFKVKPHFHKFLEIIYSIDGLGGKVIINNKIQQYEKNSLIIVPPYNTHSYIMNSEYNEFIIMGVNIYAILELFSSSILEENIRKNLLTYYNINPVQKKIKANLIQKIEDILNSKNLLSKINNFLLLSELLIDKKIKIKNKNLLNNKYIQVLEYIENHYSENIKLEDMADIIGISKFTLSKNFKILFKINFIDYINKIRIKKAKNLLLLTKKKITEISYAIGFFDLSHFNKVFKKYYNISPIKFRNKYIK